MDTVKFTGLEPGKTYRLEAVIYDKDTKEETRFKASHEFTPETKDGEVDVEIEVDTTDLDGHTIVVFEKAYYGETLIADHSEPDDEKQTVYVPKVSTSAVDKTTGVKSLLKGKTSVMDTIHYENLLPGVTYRIVGKLYVKPEEGEAQETSAKESTPETKKEETTTEGEKTEKETGSEKTVPYGQAGETVEMTFTPEKPEGDVVMTIPVETADLEGKILVAFEVLYIGEVEVADHTDIEDEAQTVYLPRIGTSLTDKQTGNKTTAEGLTTFTDTVSFKGLAPNVEYTLTAEVFVKGKEKDSAVASGTRTFTPATAEGTVDVEIEIDTEGFEKEILVCFETLTVGEEKYVLAEHKDIEDVKQSVYVPKVATKAYVSTVGGEKAAYESSAFTIVDRVFYENLVVGETYTVSGILMDKAQGAVLVVDGAPVTASVSFIAESADGYVDVTFTFNAIGLGTLTGREVVVFENLFTGDVPVKKHDDLNDVEQKITILVSNVDTSDPGKVQKFLTFFVMALGLAAILFATRKRFLVSGED